MAINLHIIGSSHPVVPYLLRLISSDPCFCVHLYSSSSTEGFLPYSRLNEDISSESVILSLSPVSKLPSLLSSLPLSPSSIISISSQSIYSKVFANSFDSVSYHHFLKGELALIDLACDMDPQPLIIRLRLPMLWGSKLDKNVHSLYSFALKYRFLPISKSAQGLRSPIHVSELAVLLYSLLCAKTNFAGYYDVQGFDVLSYAQLCKDICILTGARELFIPSFFVNALYYASSLTFFPSTFKAIASAFYRQKLDLIFRGRALPALGCNSKYSNLTFAELLRMEYNN